jgi:hypothetical protein
VTLDAAGREGLALVVPRVAEDATFWLNGERLNVAPGLVATRNRALWIDLPASGLRPSGNVLQVRVEGMPLVRNGLSQIRFGTAEELRPGYQARRFAQSALPLALFFLVPAAFLGAIPLWLKTRRPTYLLFMALCLCWLLRSVVVATPAASLPSTGPLALLVVLASLAATSIIALLGLEYLDGMPAFRRDYRRIVIIAAALCGTAAVVWALLEPLTPRALGLLHWPINAHLFALAVAHVYTAVLSPRPALVGTALGMTAWAVAVAHDLAMLHDVTDFDSFFWSPAGVLLVFLAFAWRSLEARKQR